MKTSMRGLTASAVIAATYIVLTLPFAAVSAGPVQFRAAELLTVLPFLSPYAVPGVFIGCFVSNLLFSTPIDAVVGSLATLIAAFITCKCKNVYVAALPPVIVNAVVIGAMLTLVGGSRSVILFLTYAASICLSQFIICFVIGVPFVKLIRRYGLERYLK